MSVEHALAVEVGPGGLNFTPFSRLVCRQPDYEVHFVQLNVIIAHTQLPLRLAVAAFLRAPLDDGKRPPIAEMVVAAVPDEMRRSSLVLTSGQVLFPFEDSPHITLEASRQLPARRRVPHAAFLSGLWWKLLSFQPARILMCLPYLSRIGNSANAAGLYAPTSFHVEGFSAGSYTGATIVIALCCLFPECPVSATLGAIAMPKGVMGALMEIASPGQCDIHLIHAEDDMLCNWRPTPTDRNVIAYRLRYTLVAESDKWMGTDKHKYWHWLHCSLPEGRCLLSELKLSHPDVIPIRDRMAAPLRLASWIRFETVMNQQDWRTAIELLVPQIHLPDTELLHLLRSCVPEQGISSMAEAQAILLRNFRVGGSKPDACAKWLTEVTRALFKPIPFREVFVILALFLPQLTFAEGAKLDSKLWYSPAISSEESLIHVTPLAQGLQGMREYKIAAFVSAEQPVHQLRVPCHIAFRAHPHRQPSWEGIPICTPGR